MGVRRAARRDGLLEVAPSNARTKAGRFKVKADPPYGVHGRAADPLWAIGLELRQKSFNWRASSCARRHSLLVDALSSQFCTKTAAPPALAISSGRVKCER
jgi:hypothetical protein